ncbi:biotin/lipoyl-binding carrier protein [Phenylobacterium sp.]|uniref:biotin/lipoyl-binding carrier protein n=1 Tax=Phenylobacterium sp. TaxID=1871053 RepID=UPI0025E44BF6|nr:biotin/lipoyl-binding carrier protein [Phenylobacterium sp.]MBX3484121.1 biotin/lipoyl-binding carrier protein [Phenylobacterium sp.]MCW5758484.1 biotin/lipoyl-binding carrier protein [Phenylobacterium sp.]
MAQQVVRSELAANVWKVEVAVGDKVEVDDTLMIFESMKMEIPVAAPCAGVVAAIDVEEGQSVAEGQIVAILER